MAYNAYYRLHRLDVETSSVQISIQVLLRYLPPGAKSDIANSLLEGLEYLYRLYKQSFDHLHFVSQSSNYFYSSASDNWYLRHFAATSSVVTEINSSSNEVAALASQWLTYYRAKFFL